MALPTVTTDYFSACQVDTGLWELVDPAGVGSFDINGRSLDISVAGTAEGHDIWSLPDDPDSFAYTVVRALQRVGDTDFEVEVRFDSEVDPAFQQQGIVVEQDLESLLRIEFHGNGDSTNLFIASVAERVTTPILTATIARSGIFPLFLRVKRTGSEWEVSYSISGSNFIVPAGGTFQQSLRVTKIGLFAGNGPNVDHTAVIDYFRDVGESFDSDLAMPRSCP